MFGVLGVMWWWWGGGCGGLRGSLAWVFEWCRRYFFLCEIRVLLVLRGCFGLRFLGGGQLGSGFRWAPLGRKRVDLVW